MQPVGAIGAAHRALLEVVEELLDHELRLPDDHRVAMLQRLLRHEARVDAAHDDRHPPRPERVGDLVAAVHVARHGGDADQVRLQVEVDRLDVLVGQHHFVAVARNHAGHGKQARKG